MIEFGFDARDLNAALLDNIDAIENLPRVIMGVVQEHFESLVFETPQWTGTLAASWRIGIGGNIGDGPTIMPPIEYESGAFKMGDMPAVAISLQHGAEATDAYEAAFWGSDYTDFTVYNNTEYAADVEEGLINLRANVGHAPGFFERFQEGLVQSFNSLGWRDWGALSKTRI